MKIRALAAAATAASLVLTPMAVQAGTAASSKSYGSYATSRIGRINSADGDQKGWGKKDGVWVAMTAAAAAALGLVFVLDDGNNKTPGADT